MQAKRPYLRAAERRAQLLDCAEQIIERSGLAALTISGLAAQAGTSRQLVYEHFDSLPAVVAALLLDRFATFDASIAAALASPTGPATARAAAEGLLARPPGQRRLLRALIAEGANPESELAPLAARLRARVIERWRGALEPGSPPALAWAIVNALFALGDLVDGGDLTPADALDAAERLMRSTGWTI
jgi:AcrR family transcriptional regulator